MHKHLDKIGLAAIAFALVIVVLMMAMPSPSGQMQTHAVIGYESKLFDTNKVHTIDIVMDDWEGFLSTCQSEEYTVCDVTIDGETVRNVGIRGKGNTSLSSVSSMDSDRYSFKIEFDQYDSSISYHGLDKLSLNNLIQDNTMMKDYLAYRMMDEFGAAASLCSYVYLTVNGEDWGLYLAVEAVEESFLKRNYGADYGDLYKPDSMQMGGGRGNGRDFDMNEFMAEREEEEQSDASQKPASGKDIGAAPQMTGGGFAAEGFGNFMPEGFENFDPGNFGDFDAESQENFKPEGFDFGGMGGFGGFGMGASDAKLQYVDDDADSYSTIFSSAKTVVNQADEQRLIRALKTLSSENAADALNAEQVLRYFVVHNYVVNGDSYTGSMVHNYYLYEEDGRLSMIPWDYNLAYGTFMGGSAESSVSDDIDYPLSISGSDRPMYDWILKDEAALEQYHALFAEFIETVDVQGMIAQAEALIAPYVEKDPTRFCTFEEFEEGVKVLKSFCALRSQSVSDQLSGSDGRVDTAGLDLSAMGSMGGGGGFGPGGDRMQPSRKDSEDKTEQDAADAQSEATGLGQMPEGFAPGGTEGFDPGSMTGTFPGGMMQQGFDPSQAPAGGQMPQGERPDMPQAGGMFPMGSAGGFDPGSMPQELDPNNMPQGFDPNAMGGFEAGGMQGMTGEPAAPAQEQKNGTEREDRTGNKPQRFDAGAMDRFGGQTVSRANGGSAVAIVLSGIILAAALIFAFTYKR